MRLRVVAVFVSAHLKRYPLSPHAYTLCCLHMQLHVQHCGDLCVCSLRSILYQRGIYPPETFSRVAKYGLAMLVTTDDGLKTYLAQVLSQLSQWLIRGEVQKLVVVVTGGCVGCDQGSVNVRSP